MKTLNIDNVDGIAIKLQQVKVEVGGIAADEEMVLSISEDGAHAEIWRGCEPIRFTGPQAKRFARQLLRMSKELKTAEEQTGRDSKLTEKRAVLFGRIYCKWRCLQRLSPFKGISSNHHFARVACCYGFKMVWHKESYGISRYAKGD